MHITITRSPDQWNSDEYKAIKAVLTWQGIDTVTTNQHLLEPGKIALINNHSNWTYYNFKGMMRMLALEGLWNN